MTDAKQCPKCDRLIPPGEQRCDCGYDFEAGERTDGGDAPERPLAVTVISWLLIVGAAGSCMKLPLQGGPVVAALAAPTLAIIGALACACFVKVIGAVFLGSPRSSDAQHARECSWWMRLPMLALAAPCVVLGFAPAIATPLLDRATEAWDVAGAASLPALGTLLP